MSRMRRGAMLPVSFFRRPAEVVAPELIGRVVVSRAGGRVTAGRIVETEAYLGHDDPASHGYLSRRNARNAALFGRPGTWYVYRSYGIHWCANLVCLDPGIAAAVLLRAVEPLDGLPAMRRRRGPVRDRDLCSGPGKLCAAMGITRALDGLPVGRATVTVHAGEPVEGSMIAVTPRIGITKAAEWPLRFVLAGSPWLSRPGFRRADPACAGLVRLSPDRQWRT